MEHKRKILHLVNGLGVGGAERTVQSFFRFHNPELFELTILNTGESGARQQVLLDLGATVINTNGLIDETKTVLRRLQPDVLHLHYSGQGTVLQEDLLRLAQQLGVVTIATNIFSFFDSGIDNLLDFHLFKSKMMLAVKFKKNSRKNHLPFRKYRVVYNPVDTEHLLAFELSAKEKLTIRKQLGIPKDAFVIGRVGRADTVKWGDLLLEAFPFIIRQIPNCYLVIRGLPPSRLEWVKKAPWSKQVILLPETSDDLEVMKTYQVMDVYTHTTKIGEAFGNTLNEAMAFKRPIVTHSTPHCDNGQLEQVEHGKNGYIANTPESFAAAVTYLYSSPQKREAMGMSGYRKVVDEYNPIKTTHYLERIYLEGISRSKLLTKKEKHWMKSAKAFPSNFDIAHYPYIYKRALLIHWHQSFLSSINEKFRIPARLFRRVQDYIEHSR